MYRQESVMDIAKLPLTTSSEQIVPVHAIGYYRIDDTPSKQSLMSLYAHRKTKLNQNFVELFYKTYNKKKDKKCILHISGLNSSPVYPVTYDYARSVMIFYKPWSGVNKELLTDKANVIEEFIEYVTSDECPLSVKQAYLRAKLRFENNREFVDGNRMEDEYFFHDNGSTHDVELERYVEFSNSFSRPLKNYTTMNGYKIDIGRNFNWSNNEIDENGNNWLINHIEKFQNYQETMLMDNGKKVKPGNTALDIPTMHNGLEYCADNLVGNQKAIVSAVFDNLTNWINYSNGETSTYSPLRMTVLGKGGTGKSHIINTIVAKIRKKNQNK